MKRNLGLLAFLVALFAAIALGQQIFNIGQGGTNNTVYTPEAHLCFDGAGKKFISCHTPTITPTATITPTPTNTPTPGTSVHLSIDEVPSGTIDGSNPTFTLAHTPTGGALFLYVSSLGKAWATVDYNISGATITFIAGHLPVTGDLISATYQY